MTEDLDALYHRAADRYGLDVEQVRMFADDSTTPEGVDARAAVVAECFEKAARDAETQRRTVREAAIASQLTAITAIETVVESRDINLTELFRGVEKTPALGVLICVAAQGVALLDSEDRARYLAYSRERIAAGHSLPEGFAE